MYSPLAINLRFKILGPRTIDLITKVLQVFYAPPVLIPLLIVIAVAYGWLYFVHGVAGSVQAALYTPGGLLAVLALLLVAGVVHEFGHAAALRYGGGTVRGMGAGLYLIYPALYTDTTDSYRLGRWARVRTDLGGFYFHMIFTLGILALYFAVGHELLLFVVVLINLDILTQCLPFVRFDGYWALADLTGTPDFFSQMGAFVRSLVPIRGLAGSKLPPLKPWVKAVFATYVLITVPVLAYLYVLLVTQAPHFLLTTWDSLLVQAAAFSGAQGQGDVWQMVLSTTQMLLLALSALAMGYLLYKASRLPMKMVWNWSKPTPARRLVGTLGVAIALAMLAYVWAPQLLSFGG